jgi:hypothetical protein
MPLKILVIISVGTGSLRNGPIYKERYSWFSRTQTPTLYQPAMGEPSIPIKNVRRLYQLFL